MRHPAELSIEKKIIITAIIIIPLFFLVFNEMKVSVRNSTTSYIKCDDGSYHEVNESTPKRELICGNPRLVYEPVTNRIYDKYSTEYYTIMYIQGNINQTLKELLSDLPD